MEQPWTECVLPEFTSCSPNPYCGGIWGRAVEWRPADGRGTFMRRDQGSPSLPLPNPGHRVRCGEKAAARKRSQTWGATSVCCLSPSFCGLLLQQPEVTETEAGVERWGTAVTEAQQCGSSFGTG